MNSNQLSPELNDELKIAIRDGNIEPLKVLGYYILYREIDLKCILTSATVNDRLNIIEYIIDEKDIFNVNSSFYTKEERTRILRFVMLIATKYNHLDIFKYLVEKKYFYHPDVFEIVRETKNTIMIKYLFGVLSSFTSLFVLPNRLYDEIVISFINNNCPMPSLVLFMYATRNDADMMKYAIDEATFDDIQGIYDAWDYSVAHRYYSVSDEVLVLLKETGQTKFLSETLYCVLKSKDFDIVRYLYNNNIILDDDQYHELKNTSDFETTNFYDLMIRN